MLDDLLDEGFSAETLNQPVIRALFAVMHPQLYLQNAYRLTQLPIEVSIREITKRKQVIQAAISVQATLSPGPQPIFPLPPDTTTFEHAIERMQDPVERLIDALFWFWPAQLGQQTRDAAIDGLIRGDRSGVIHTWMQQIKGPQPQGVASHNLAVNVQLIGLEWEELAKTSQLNNEQNTYRSRAWTDAMLYWKQTCEDAAFWSMVEQWMQKAQDPRLSAEALPLLRQVLPIALLIINVELMIAYTERRQSQEAKFQQKIFQNAPFDQRVKDEALRHGIQPIRDRLRTLCDNSEQQGRAEPRQGGEVATRLLDQGLVLLATIDIAYPERHPIRESAHERIIEAGTSCLIPFGNETERWSEVLTQIDRLIQIAQEPTARDKLIDQRAIVLGNRDVQRVQGAFDGLNAEFEKAVEDAKNDPLHADQVTTRLLQAGETWLRQIDATLSAGNQVRDDSHDRLANIALSCLIDYGNATSNWPVILPIMQRIAPIAVSKEVRERIQLNIRTVTENMQFQIAASFLEQVEPVCVDAIKRAKERPSIADGITIRLLDQLMPLLNEVDRTLPNGDEIRLAIHDRVVQTALSCQIEFANDSNRWDIAIPIIERIAHMEMSAEVRQRVHLNLETARNNREGQQRELLLAEFIDFLEKALQETRANQANAAGVPLKVLTQGAVLLNKVTPTLAGNKQAIDAAYDKVAETALLCIGELNDNRRRLPQADLISLLERAYNTARNAQLRKTIADILKNIRGY